MPIVKELHFKRSALEYIEKAKMYVKEKDYVSAAYEWEKAAEEGYYLAHKFIADYYVCDYFDVEGLSNIEKYKRAIEIFKTLLEFNLREFDYLRIMSAIGYAYKKLGYMNDAYEYYLKAGDEGLYHLYMYYYDRKNYTTADRYYERYKSISHLDPGHVYFDL